MSVYTDSSDADAWSLEEHRCPEGHCFCIRNLLRRQECICERWIVIQYVGHIYFSQEQWREFFNIVLDNISVEYLGYYVPSITVDGATVYKWNFYFLLDNSIDVDTLMNIVGDKKICLDKVQTSGDDDMIVVYKEMSLWFTHCSFQFFSDLNPCMDIGGDHFFLSCNIVGKFLELERNYLKECAAASETFVVSD